MNLNHFYHYYKSKSGGLSNLLLGSEELDQSDQGEWVRYNMNAVNANVPGVANPLSSDETVEQLDFEASNVARIAQTVTLTAGTEYTFSVWARAASGTEPFRLRYWDNVGGSGGGSAFTASATWSASTGRYEMTFTAQNSGTFQMFIQNAGGTAVSRRIYFWGAMLNVGGAALDYVKTEFPTGPSNPPTAPMEFGDNFAGVTAYYSLRRFTKGEDNNAIRVRRSSDDTEQDIGFDANGDLDTTALLAFVGTGGTDNGFVTTFYDQSGNGNNATNATASEQPLVVSGGTLVEENSKAALDFDGVDDVLVNSAYSYTGTDIPFSIIYTGSFVNDSSNQRMVVLGTSSASFSAINGLLSTVTFNGSSGGGDNKNETIATGTFNGTQHLIEIYSNGTTGTGALDSAAVSLDTDYVNAMNYSGISLGGFPTFSFTNQKAQEIIIFESDQSANRTSMETNINDHFDIYT